ncbi:hypothetical protein BCV69DRAFT_284140 [Microstroma glucosiphilum]|uniref:Kinetochore protein Sos7 coiled-coil domain-containing protein n=1 Tax=Pseudomicrostroma glucosiphilum TaxID=1684307 RepID=A0A316U419_9BASI|nr:hypothetical protein BCV69DRAFT_284140 [Pseudomicrostroma glucosiphilum]PWN19514.1 hypothetical protein BCV69DRAFT_284140 [Pseudomicrostroma glucosiphilum]
MARPSRRSTVNGGRRSLLADQTNIAQFSPAKGDSDSKGSKRTSLQGVTREEKRVEVAGEEAKRILSSLDTSSGGYNLHNLVKSFASRQKVKTGRTSEEGGAHHGSSAWNPLDIEWSVFQDWPEGLEKEEREMKQYYKYLKFIHLEHETKIRFITEIVEDPEADPPREAIVYSARDVKEKEAEMFAAKAQLKQGKQIVRALRAENDAIAARVSVPFMQIQNDSAEAKALLDEIDDLELELVKIKSEGGTNGSAGVTELDVEEMDLEALPPVGSLTEQEAVRFIERQEEGMAQLEDENSNADEIMKRLRSDTKAAIKAVDRLASESHVAERQAKEAREMGVGGKKRDKEVERICGNHIATLGLLRSLFGLRRIEALEDNRISLAWVSEKNGCEMSVVLQFDQPGGKLESVELHHPTQATPIHLPPRSLKSKARTAGRPSQAHTASEQELVDPQFGPLLKAIQANDVPVVVMEAWDWDENLRMGTASGGVEGDA